MQQCSRPLPPGVDDRTILTIEETAPLTPFLVRAYCPHSVSDCAGFRCLCECACERPSARCDHSCRLHRRPHCHCVCNRLHTIDILIMRRASRTHSPPQFLAASPKTDLSHWVAKAYYIDHPHRSSAWLWYGASPFVAQHAAIRPLCH